VLETTIEAFSAAIAILRLTVTSPLGCRLREPQSLEVFSRGLFEEPYGVLQIEPAQERLPEQVDLFSGEVGGRP
jgi:hypothetical protein